MHYCGLLGDIKQQISELKGTSILINQLAFKEGSLKFILEDPKALKAQQVAMYVEL